MSDMLANAPVYYALAQVRFEPVAAMGKYADELQDRLRKSGFPHYETEQTQAVNFFAMQNGASLPVGIPMPIANASSLWYFSNPERSFGYVLSNDFITFHTTSYEEHEAFFKRVLEGIELLNSVVGLGNITRVGVRYLDAIIPEEGESIRDYLDPSVLGIDFGLDWMGGSWEGAYKSEHGVLISKIYRVANQPVGTPIDLQIKAILLPEKFRSNRPVHHAVMDLDHYSEAIMPPQSEALDQTLRYLHQGISDCFKALSTAHAFKRWQQ